MTRGDRVRVNYGDVWPQCVCWPAGKTGTVLEVIGDKAIIRLDEFSNQNTTVELKDLEAITMSEVVQYPIDDTEYMTPQDARRLRDAKAIDEYHRQRERYDRGELDTLRLNFKPGEGYSVEAIELHRAINGTTGMESEE